MLLIFFIFNLIIHSSVLCENDYLSDEEELYDLNGTIERLGESCVTSHDKLGSCIQIEKCKYFTEMSDFSYGIEYAKNNTCGRFSYGLLICCPVQKEEITLHNSLLAECYNLEKEKSPHVFNGTVSKPHAFPWVALIKYEDAFSKHQSYDCGGSLISDRYVVTAAHCLLMSQKIVAVNLGTWDFNATVFTENITEPIEIGINETIVHPNYRSDHKRFDIGLIRLNRSINYNEFSESMRPINLPINIEYRDEEKVSIAGFGETEYVKRSLVKLQGDITLIEFGKCKNIMNTRGIEIHETQLCANSDVVDTCYGDSGGPLTILVSTANTSVLPCYYLLGIVSYGMEPCANGEFPSVYTNVVPFVDWISQNIKP